jgi:dienelactone hydrolase
MPSKTMVGRVAAAVLATALLSACGGSDDTSGAPSLDAGTTGGEVTAPERELIHGCIDPDQAKALTIKSGSTLEAAVFGDGPVGVVAAHELGGSLCDWASIASDLADEGYRVLVFDFGTPATAASDMLAATKKLRDLGAKRIIVGGASLGGTAALMTAARARNVVGAFSLSAPTAYGNLEGLPAVRRFHGPILFVAGAGDIRFADDARLLYRAAASSEKELLIVAGREHGTDLYGGAAAERVGRAVDDLLKAAAH